MTWASLVAASLALAGCKCPFCHDDKDTGDSHVVTQSVQPKQAQASGHLSPSYPGERGSQVTSETSSAQGWGNSDRSPGSSYPTNQRGQVPARPITEGSTIRPVTQQPTGNVLAPGTTETCSPAIPVTAPQTPENGTVQPTSAKPVVPGMESVATPLAPAADVQHANVPTTHAPAVDHRTLPPAQPNVSAPPMPPPPASETPPAMTPVSSSPKTPPPTPQEETVHSVSTSSAPAPATDASATPPPFPVKFPPTGSTGPALTPPASPTPSESGPALGNGNEK
jgi:hypothetical protein